MRKNKFFIAISVLILVLAIIIVWLIVIKNEKYVDNSITMEDLTSINYRIKNGENITIKDFKEFELKDKEDGDTVTKYIYNMNSKYEVLVMENNGRIVSIVLNNKVTYTSVDIMYSSLENFLATE